MRVSAILTTCGTEDVQTCCIITGMVALAGDAWCQSPRLERLFQGFVEHQVMARLTLCHKIFGPMMMRGSYSISILS